MLMHDQNMKKKIIVIADDLTGANDTGVQFAKQGLDTIVLLGTDSPPERPEEDVVVMDTGSRSLGPQEAYDTVAKAARFFKNIPFCAIFKKIDSTLRGNLGREIDAVMDTCGQELAVIAPAFPRNGRTTIGGYHFLHGVPLEATEASRDPVCPVTETHLPTLLSSQSQRKVGHVGIKPTMAGLEGILAAIGELTAAGTTVIACDAWQEAHLKNLATAARQLEKQVLWVGSAGLAAYLPAAFRMSAEPMACNPVLVLAGSVSRVTRSQVTMLRSRPDMACIEVAPCRLLQHDTSEMEIHRCCHEARQALTAGKDVVIVSGSREEAVTETQNKGFALGFTDRQTAEAVAGALGDLCRQIATNTPLSGMVLTGGDIALSCCRLLSASGMKVMEEISPGIPLGRLKGGPWDGLRVVTKAGAFGEEDALCRAVDRLKSFNPT